MSDKPHVPGDVNPWHPMTDMIDLKTLGKLGEELSECAAAASRCIIQGINEVEPETGKPNKRWLEDEIADVLANILLTMDRFDLDPQYINDRRARKFAMLRAWHKLA